MTPVKEWQFRSKALSLEEHLLYHHNRPVYDINVLIVEVKNLIDESGKVLKSQ